MPKRKETLVDLSNEERRLLRRAIKIAMEDRSIYADVEIDGEKAVEYRTVKLETLLAKLTALEE